MVGGVGWWFWFVGWVGGVLLGDLFVVVVDLVYLGF